MTEEEQKFIDEFKRIQAEGMLCDYEKKHRVRISDASLIVKDAFDQQWRKVTDNSYYQPVTTVKPQVTETITERSDPRSRKYRANVIFKSISWQKLRRKISKRFRYLYTLHGVVAATDKERPIFQNLEVERLKEILGDKPAQKILDSKEDHGEINGTFDLLVEGYWEVQFSPMRSDNDTIDVQLGWEGQWLVIQRMKPVIQPGFYLEVADNATRDHYAQTPEKGRKLVGKIQEYPYTTLREASREEYLAQKGAGDKIMREKRAREE